MTQKVLDRWGSMRAELDRRAGEIERLREGLRPLAALKTPNNPQGTAGFYSIRYSDIERARALTGGQRKEA